MVIKMVYKNAEFHNAAEFINNADGSVSWRRVPSRVYDAMESEQGKRMAVNSTGVEIRFVLHGDKAVVRMCTEDGNGLFHVYRGGIQGGWMDHEVHKHVGTEPEDFVIERSDNIEKLKEMTKIIGHDWDCEVIRIIFDRGNFKIYDIDGDISAPTKEQCPKNTILCYGSSITHGSNSLDMSHSWVSCLAYNLNMDARNLGMAGSCAMEPEMADYIATLGEQDVWDIATLELGINVLEWEEEKIHSRVRNIIEQVAGRNPQKPVFVISPFYHCGEYFGDNNNTAKWRRVIGEEVSALNYKNVTYINGLDVLGDMSYISADEVHPNIYGVQKIASELETRIRNVLKL